MGRKARSKRAQDAQTAATHQQDQLLDANYATAKPAVISAVHNQEVDSWRSYRNDATNLQSLNIQSGTPGFDPTAPSFVPEPFAQSQTVPAVLTQSRFKPYQPLRISNGQHERQILQQAKLQNIGHKSQITVTQGSGRHVSKGIREMSTSLSNQVDKPIPSIELNNSTWSQFGGRPISEVLQQTSRKSQSRASRTPTPSPPPKPTQEYMVQANLDPYRLERGSQKLLVVLDLNGTLLYRRNRGKDPTNINIRPGVTPLLQYLFENHTVMVYTSARPENAAVMVNKIIHPAQRQKLVAIWARDKLGLTSAQYNSKVQVYKKLEKIWEDPVIQAAAEEGKSWDQTNTILVDDSHLKASSQPYNLLQVPEFVNDRPDGTQKIQNAWLYAQLGIVQDLQQKIELLRWQGDVSREIRKWQLGDDARQPVTSKKREKTQTQKQKEAEVQAKQLLTPKSPVEPSSDSELDDITGGGVEVKSVSPIDEAVWSSLLAGDEKDGSNTDVPPTPSSMGP